MQRLSRTLTRWLASPVFFYAVLAFFVLEALWFVFSAAYPMAFDEDFHFGIIKIYAHQWSPFLRGQPANADQFGALAVDPSYFFHYLMSFPLRLIQVFTHNETIQVILLRLLNVGMFAAALLLFRRVMLRAGASTELSNVSLALFVLIPIVPQLAAHINYDNLLMVLVAWICLVSLDLLDGFRERRVALAQLLTFAALCLFTSIVKYAALPLLLGAMLYLAWAGYRTFRGHFGALGKQLRGEFKRLSLRLKWLFAGVLVIGSVLFVQRYGTNLVVYHTPVPDCGQVLTVEQCQQYGPWGRDYKLSQAKAADFEPSITYYLSQWFLGMRHRLFFAVSGPTNDFVNYNGLPAPVLAFTALVIGGIAVTIIWFRRIFHHQYLILFGCMIAFYVAVLLTQQYGMYTDTSFPVAINGRYLLPVLLLLAVIVGRGLSLAAAHWKIQAYKPFAAVLVLLFFLHGGGVLTFILRSDSSWYWPNHAVQALNNGVRSVLRPLILPGNKDAEHL